MAFVCLAFIRKKCFSSLSFPYTIFQQQNIYLPTLPNYDIYLFTNLCIYSFYFIHPLNLFYIIYIYAFVCVYTRLYAYVSAHVSDRSRALILFLMKNLLLIFLMSALMERTYDQRRSRRDHSVFY